MRVTNNMMSQNLLRNLETAQERMSQLQDQMSSGQRITRPSDDPVGIQNALRMKSSLSAVDQWKNNTDEALGLMDTTDGVLGGMTSMLQRVRELAVQGANGALSGNDRAVIALEVDQIAEQLHMTANTKVGSKYIFSGTATDKELIPTDGSLSQANGEEIMYEVGNNLNLPISVKGQELFGNDTSGVFATLKGLSEALKSNDSDGINTALGNVDLDINTVINVRSTLGARTNRMSALKEQLETTSFNLTKNISDILDADIAKTIIDFKNSENIYKAALSIGAQIIQPSLVDFLR